MLEMLFAMAFWPWVLTLVFLAALCTATWKEMTSIAVMAIGVFSALAWFAFSSSPLGWIASNPGSAVAATALYAFAGGLWSLFKWDRWMASERIQDAIRSARKGWQEILPHPNHPSTSFYESYMFPQNAKPGENKDRIVSWIALWPFSLTGYFIGEIALRAFSRIYDALASTYSGITKRHAGGN